MAKKPTQKKPTDARAKWVKRVVEEIKQELHLTEWRFSFEFPTKNRSDDQRGTTAAADIHVLAEYLDATICIYPFFFDDLDDEERKMTLLHEVCHVFGEPYKNLCRKMANGRFVSETEECEVNEKLTSTLEHLLAVPILARLKNIKLK